MQLVQTNLYENFVRSGGTKMNSKRITREAWLGRISH